MIKKFCHIFQRYKYFRFHYINCWQVMIMRKYHQNLYQVEYINRDNFFVLIHYVPVHDDKTKRTLYSVHNGLNLYLVFKDEGTDWWYMILLHRNFHFPSPFIHAILYPLQLKKRWKCLPNCVIISSWHII